MNDFCFLDIETTGLDASKDSILEISFIRKKEGKIISSVDQVIIPNKSPLTPFVTNLTGITPEEVEKSGTRLEEVCEEIIDKIGDSVIVGHNIDFDIDFLVRNGIDVSKNHRIDTHELARIVLKGEESYALEILSIKYGFQHKEAHRAMSDVEACIDLLELLTEKIKKLPLEFLQSVRKFLEEKTDWYAKYLFLRVEAGASGAMHSQAGAWERGVEEGVSTKSQKLQSKSETLNQLAIPTSDFPLSTSRPLFCRISDSILAAEATISTAEKIAEECSVLIITPKLKFFKDVRQFSTPEVILDPEKLFQFIETRTKLDNKETVFFLKCMYRHLLGFRGQNNFDLFFQEQGCWKEVALNSVEHPIFKEIIKERAKEKILALTPKAFFQFHDLECFRCRTLIIDEAEVFAEDMLNFPTKTVSLEPYLNSKNEEIATSTLFFIKNFCREVIEKKLNHAITPFPEKVLFEPKETFPEFAEILRSLSLQEAADILENKGSNFLFSPPDVGGDVLSETRDRGRQSTIVRWSNYYPETGNLTINSWQFSKWEKLKAEMKKFPKILLHRHKIDDCNTFFKTFLSIEEAEFIEDKALFAPKKLEIPKNLISANDPKFNDFCGEKIIEIVRNRLHEGESMLVNFSSRETLKNIYTQTTELLKNDNISIMGERIAGGEGKLLKLLQSKQEIIFFNQKFIHPELEHLNWKIIVIQKFPFLPPSPLLKAIEASLKQSGKNFWDAWTIPMVAANLSRRTSSFSGAKKIIFIDPRQNTRWGKAILKRAF